MRLTWEDGQFVWDDADFGRFPLTLGRRRRTPTLGATILDQVGRLSRAARRVEVPFEFIAPAPEQWWTGDSRAGLDVPLGRAGATSRQLLRLGQGTSQHVLIAGKTGSGKSTLLHALITNLALLYSPDEVELYLVDFKKGVEFKTYAAHGLPHARVIAIESEREFGLSVLQRLDAELKVRGEALPGGRRAGPQRRIARPSRACAVRASCSSWTSFRSSSSRTTASPRTRPSCLDRLVRQGRAFGMHVLLGSQTLGGAYSLARSTIDQMAVRIALAVQRGRRPADPERRQLGGAAAVAARRGDLQRRQRPGRGQQSLPGGLAVGRAPRGVPEPDPRPGGQRRIAGAGPGGLRGQRRRPTWPTIICSVSLLSDAAAAGRRGSRGPAALRAWLGDALAINDLTAAAFRRQNGSNLLIVGQQDQMALGDAHLGRGQPGRAESAAARFYPHRRPPGGSADRRRRGRSCRDVLPQTVRLAGWRDVPAVMGELAAELERRQKEPDADAPPIYLVIYGLQRCRDLRRREDDFSFGRAADEPPNPPKQFADLLREGAVARHPHADLVRHATRICSGRWTAPACANWRCAWCSR